MKKYFLLVVTVLFLLSSFWGCTTTPAKKPTEANYDNCKGKLITPDGYTFPYKFYPVDRKSASVIYIPGGYGKTGREGPKSGGWLFQKPINETGFNFIGFDRYDAVRISGLRVAKMRERLDARGKSGSALFPTKDGKESGTENIARNEVSAIIEFVEGAPTHDKTKGIYLIGKGLGSLLSLYAAQAYPDSIKGIIFLSPDIYQGTFRWARNSGEDLRNNWNSYFIYPYI